MSRSERVYRALLKVCPGHFRREYGPQMEQVFGDQYREAYERGGRPWIALLWALTISDLARTAVAQRIRRRTDHEEVAMYDRRLAVVGCVLLLAPLYFVSASLLEYGEDQAGTVEHRGRCREHPVVGDAAGVRVSRKLHLPSVVSRTLYSLAGPSCIRRGASG